MLGAIDFVENYLRHNGRPVRIGLFGVSRGAGSAILAAVRRESVRAIVTDGAFSSDQNMEYLMKRFASIFARIRVVAENHPPVFWRFFRWLLFRECNRRFGCDFPSVRKAVAQVGSTPILFIHGERDSYLPIEQSQALYELAKGSKRLWIVPGAKHNQCVIVRPDEYAARVVQFFRESLVGRPEAVPPALKRAVRRRQLGIVDCRLSIVDC
jgi:fermentation-respiration switch protein FrsA (DUF1100 family)